MSRRQRVPNRLAQKRLTKTALSFALVGSFALAGGVVLGCSKSESKGGDNAAPATTATAAGAPQTPAELGLVLATIDGVDITVGEFQDRINKQSPYIRARYTSNEQKREFLDNLVRFEVLAQQAKSEGFDKDIDVVRTMKQVMIQKLMKARFEDGISPDNVTDEAMQTYYDANPTEFNKPEELRVSAIIVPKKADADAVAKEALGEKGTTNRGFRELVLAHSTDEESKKRGGDLRYFSRSTTDVPKEVVDAAFALKKTGDVAGPISTSDGSFYVIKQTGHRTAVSKSFEQVKRQLQNRLYRDMRTKAQKDFVEELKAKAKIEIFDDKLGEVQVDTSAPATGDPHGGHGAHGGGSMPPMPGHPAQTEPSQATPESH
jgi:peptidyl-prolyl cis-trans isomerase C